MNWIHWNYLYFYNYFIIISIFKHNFYSVIFFNIYIHFLYFRKKSEFIFVLYFLFLLIMHNIFKKLNSYFRNTLHRKSCKTNFILRLGKNLYINFVDWLSSRLWRIKYIFTLLSSPSSSSLRKFISFY